MHDGTWLMQNLRSGEYDGVACQVSSCVISGTRMGSCSESRSVEALASMGGRGGGVFRIRVHACLS